MRERWSKKFCTRLVNKATVIVSEVKKVADKFLWDTSSDVNDAVTFIMETPARNLRVRLE